MDNFFMKQKDVFFYRIMPFVDSDGILALSRVSKVISNEIRSIPISLSLDKCETDNDIIFVNKLMIQKFHNSTFHINTVTEITNEGIKALSSLTYLNLSYNNNNKITDEGIKGLSSLTKLRRQQYY